MMSKLVVLTLLSIQFLLPTLLGAEIPEDYWQLYLKSYPQTVVDVAAAPLSWETQSWQRAGAVVILGAGLYLADEEIRDFFVRNRSSHSDALSGAVRQFGEYDLVLGSLGVTLVGAYLWDSPETMDTGFLCLKSVILANCATQGFKLISQRERPFREAGKEFFNGSGISLKRDAFPSGHSTIAWSLAPVLASQYKDHSWVAPTVYSLAALTSISRLHDDVHWASDVFAGAVIGYVCAKTILQDTPRLSIMPDPSSRGLVLDYRF